jgi:hypothetical protein
MYQLCVGRWVRVLLAHSVEAPARGERPCLTLPWVTRMTALPSGCLDAPPCVQSESRARARWHFSFCKGNTLI